jgi:hypothetical protein
MIKKAKELLDNITLSQKNTNQFIAWINDQYPFAEPFMEDYPIEYFLKFSIGIRQPEPLDIIRPITFIDIIHWNLYIDPSQHNFMTKSSTSLH